MKKIIGLVSCLVLVTGCATHRYSKTANDPATSSTFECVETGNGSTNCEEHTDSKIVGGANGGFQQGVGYSEYGSPLTTPIPYGGTGMVRFRQTTDAGRAMERMPGGTLELAPVDASEFVTQDQFEPVLIMTGKNTQDIKKIKKGSKDNTQKSPPPANNGMQDADSP